ncbi:MAG: dihydroorotate dehydrogenase electron transfer subunit [Candidatus Kerfeldbacteria bacterium]|nr:dihydroorotate dehydrogenase electron transfer subunit [Candidatus Kerfeldbacteria bacterium]
MKPRIATLLNIKPEADNVVSFMFRYSQLGSKPGQFVMLWLPGIDQKPFSIAADNGKTFSVAVFKIKDFTEALFKLKPGANIGVTGPFGNPYTWKPRSHVIAVGGGYGSAPLAYLVNAAKVDHCTYEVLIGARHKKLLLYPTRFPKHTYLATDDGSAGYHGYVTALLEQRVSVLSAAQRKKTVLYVCGPELMEYAAATVAKKYGLPSQISIERYIKCGFGICGQCCVDDTGEPMCTVGPVISGKHALRLSEFGQYHRNKAGEMIEY